jgi:dTDP-4-dehydrorhamnose reductase
MAHAIPRAAAHAKARFIHISTDVISDGENAPYDERAQPNPITSYGESKARGERAVISAHPEAVIVRTSLIYGFDPMDSVLTANARWRNAAALYR